MGVFVDNTDNQQLTLTGQELAIQNGNTVILPDKVNDADADPTNEIQAISITGHELTIAEGNTITLPDEVNDADHDPGNELQMLSIGHDTIYLRGGGFVKMPATITTGGQYYYLDKDGDGYGNRFVPV